MATRENIKSRVSITDNGLVGGTPPGHWHGPPYSTSETNWPGRPRRTNRLCDMESTVAGLLASFGRRGSVYFDGGPGGYQAKQVFDPHGLRTDLHYNTNGHLDTVTQEGGGGLALAG